MQSHVPPPGATAGHDDGSAGATGRAGEATDADVPAGEQHPAGAPAAPRPRSTRPRPGAPRAQLDLPLAGPHGVADTAPDAPLERRLLEALPQAVAVYDGDRRYVLVNRRAAQLLRRLPEEIVGRRDEELAAPERVAPRIAALERALRTGAPQRLEEILDAGGTPMTLLVDVIPRRGPGGCLEMAAVANDVTEEKRHYRLAQEQMQSAEHAALRNAALQAVTSALAGALTPAEVGEIVVREGLLALGAAACALALPSPAGGGLAAVHAAGYAPELLDALLGAGTPGGSVAADALRTGLPVVLHDSDDWRLRYPAHAPAHAAAGLGAAAVMPLAVERSVLGVLLVSFDEHRKLSHDETDFLRVIAGQATQALERARLYETAERARSEAQEANAAKDQFLAMVSHELRNPLTAVQTGVEVLRRQGVLTGRAARALDIIDRNAKLQGRLVNDLLDLSRLTRGKIQLQRAPLALGAAVRSACQAYEAEAEEAGVALVVDGSADLWVHGDFDRLEQVVHNLVSNALKFTPAGGRVMVSTGRVEGDGDSTARLVVADTGIGIEAARLPTLFAMFQQGEVGAQRRPGLGIGLTLVRGIVERHGGRVWAESDGVGRGSRFIVDLPLVPRPRDEARIEPSASASSLAVLVVEDNPDTRTLLADGLGMIGYHVETAGSAEDALAYLAGARPDVILADIGLPGLDGFELIRRARTLPGMEHVIAFAVTGYGSEDDVRRGREAGFSGHFVKPVDIAVLDRRIRERIPTPPLA